jgi:hypothetical protein
VTRQDAIEKLRTTDWFSERPPSVQSRILSHPPTHYYELATTGQIVAIVAYGEDEGGGCPTCRVYVDPDVNPFRFCVGHQVFGIAFDDLRPLDTVVERPPPGLDP